MALPLASGPIVPMSVITEGISKLIDATKVTEKAIIITNLGIKMIENMQYLAK
jgi:hypothetical protein